MLAHEDTPVTRDPAALVDTILPDAEWALARAKDVALDPAGLARVGAELATASVPVPAWNAELHYTDGTPRTANALLVLDALNFSFWGEPRWHVGYRGRRLRGYWALAASIKRAIEEGFDLTDATVMAGATPEQLRHALRGEHEIPLFEVRLAHLHEVGRVLLERYDGQFADAIARSGRSAVALVKRLVTDFPNFRDTASYEGREIGLFKRAQILPADVFGAFGRTGLGAFDDIGALTAFADYKVPQVLHKLGVLRYGDALTARLRAGAEIPAGSPLEVELRVATIAGTEALRRAVEANGRTLSAIELDWILWEQGLSTTAEDLPYHLTRTTAY